nr:uroporphyrinogen-III C-methyltransferase [Lysobacter chinensis]
MVFLAALAAAGWYGWHWWQAREADARAQVASADHRLDALAQRLDAIRDDQRAQVQRLQQAEATNRVLRDELLGIGQRAALLEESVTRLADPNRDGVQALRLEEVEMLLVFGQQRLEIAGDLTGAQRSYAMADAVLTAVKDPAYVNLRQALIQERAAIDALGADPRAAALARIDAFARGLSEAPPVAAGPAPAADAPWWKRAFANVFDIQPRDRVVAELPSDRAAALAALQLELTLARAAAERRDEAGFGDALARARGWLERLWPESAALDARRAGLDEIAALPLSLSVPTLGSTLQQLRQLRAAADVLPSERP